MGIAKMKGEKLTRYYANSKHPLINTLAEIIVGSRLNACIMAASLRPETKVAVSEFAVMMGGYAVVAKRWYEIMHWVKDQHEMGRNFDDELRGMLIGLAAAIRVKNLEVG